MVIRTRPPLPRELHNDRPFSNIVKVDDNGRAIIICEDLTQLNSNGEVSEKGGGGGSRSKSKYSATNAHR